MVVLPHWPEKDCFRALQDGARRVLVLPQADHGYLHGGQHCKPLLWQPANHDSAVLLLQSEAAAKATAERKVMEARHTKELSEAQEAEAAAEQIAAKAIAERKAIEERHAKELQRA